MPKEPAGETKAGEGAGGGEAPAAEGSRWRDLAAAVSLANLCFFRFWHKILFATPLLAPVWSWRDLLAIAVNVSGFAACFWMLLRLGRRSRRFPGWHRCLYLIAPLVVLRIVELRYFRSLTHLWEVVTTDSALILATAVAALGTSYALVRWRRVVLAAAEVFTLCLFAFVPATFLQTAWILHSDVEVRKGGLRASAPLLP